MGLETDRKKDRLEKGKWKGKENWKERPDIEIRIKTRRMGKLVRVDTVKERQTER